MQLLTSLRHFMDFCRPYLEVIFLSIGYRSIPKVNSLKIIQLNSREIFVTYCKLSPILFALYVMDLGDELMKSGKGISLGESKEGRNWVYYYIGRIFYFFLKIFYSEHSLFFHGDELNGVRYQKTSKRTSGGYIMLSQF